MSGIVGKNLGRGSGIIAATPVGADTVSGANLADDACNSEHYTDGSIDLVHLQTGTDGQIISWDASGDPVAVGPGSDGEVLTSTGAGSPPAFEAAGGGVDENRLAQAWISFIGTGTVTIKDDFNVSSVTDNGTGDYTINFSSAFPDANYSWAHSCKNASAPNAVVEDHNGTRAVGSIDILGSVGAGTVTDFSIICCNFMGN